MTIEDNSLDEDFDKESYGEYLLSTEVTSSLGSFMVSSDGFSEWEDQVWVYWFYSPNNPW